MRPTGGMSSPVPVGKPTVVLCVGPTDVPWLSTRAAGSLKGDVPQRLFLPSRTGVWLLRVYRILKVLTTGLGASEIMQGFRFSLKWSPHPEKLGLSL